MFLLKKEPDVSKRQALFKVVLFYLLIHMFFTCDCYNRKQGDEEKKVTERRTEKGGFF